MPSSQSDRPCLIEGLFTMSLGSYTLYYNPLGSGGVVVVDADSQELIELCDGNRSLEDMSSTLGRSYESVRCDADALVEHEFLYVSGRSNSVQRRETSGNLTCWVHLTNSCNLACGYCYIHRSPGNMSASMTRMLIDKMLASCRRAKVATISLKFSGGEPLLRFDELRQAIEYAESTRGEIRANYLVLTNSVLMTPEIAEYLAEHNVSVGTSLDGLKEAHDATRRTASGGGSFDDVIKGIDTLVSGGVSPTVNVTISETNYRNILDLTARILDERWKFRYSLERDTTTGSPAVLKHQDEVISELMACYDLIEERLPNRDILQSHRFGDAMFSRSADRSCGAGSSFFSVGHDGQIGVCGLGLESPIGSLYDEGDLLENVRGSNALFAARTAKEYEGCSQCVWRGSCAGACPLQTISTYGRYNTKSPYCEVYRAVLPRILRIRGLQMIRDYESG